MVIEVVPGRVEMSTPGVEGARAASQPPTREPVDVVIPFSGSRSAFEALAARLRALELGPEDSLTVVDNRRRAGTDTTAPLGPMRIVAAPERQSSYYARNRGVAGGRATWLVFLDADVDPAPDLIDRYFDPAPQPGTGFLVGSVNDICSAGAEGESIASRYSRRRRLIDQANTLQMRRPYAKTANCAVRRAAFEEAGGFVDDVRSGGDADLCLRLQSSGWEFELRPDALAEHWSRRRVGQLLAQRSRHGSGAEWLEERYAGFAGPRRCVLGLARNIVGGALRALVSYGRGDVDSSIVQLLDPISNAAFEIGRRIPNATWREQPALALASPRRWLGAMRPARGVTD